MGVNNYEMMVIIEPGLMEEEIEKLINKITGILTKEGGYAVEEINRWGMRRLAYPIKNRREGLYVVINFRSKPERIRAIEESLIVIEPILRHLITLAVIPSTKEESNVEEVFEEVTSVQEDEKSAIVQIEEGD